MPKTTEEREYKACVFLEISLPTSTTIATTKGLLSVSEQLANFCQVTQIK